MAQATPSAVSREGFPAPPISGGMHVAKRVARNTSAMSSGLVPASSAVT
jgi:hypothetical protein